MKRDKFQIIYTKAKISTNAMAKFGRNEDVRVGVLKKICLTLDCKMDDIIDIVPESKVNK